ncbi:DNA-binding protein [Pseudomonas fakonensis]|uniref:DNA-binding protein n=1 Tax=Pseudomonas fakonensis TaxID=2842355 RepID=A0ABX8NAY5_9PSED|nr:DNA-binding protein [Pseudomonas fakonensis]QXH52578.1 DNA-binding protein [Pseudomonas fakonensis]
MEYEFTLKYQLADDEAPETLVERLGAAGCDDAVVGTGQPGRLALAFAREADSALAALQSALDDVRKVLPQAQLIEATPDLVGLTDVAQRVGVTRQNMRKLMLTHYRSFPAPVHDGGTALWHLADVLAWMQARGGYPVEQPVLELASAAMRVNIFSAYERLVQ